MDEITAVLLILALLIGGPTIVFFAGERVNRSVDEDTKPKKLPMDERF